MSIKQTCYRHIELLRLLPVQPSRKSTSELLQGLQAQGFSLSLRTLQRDLKDLQGIFPIQSDGSRDIPGWCWRRDAKKLELPQMEPATALTFKLVQQFLLRFMPPDVVCALQGYLDSANDILYALDNPLANWPEKIQVVSRTQPLLPPVITSEVLEAVYQALLSSKQIEATYRPLRDLGEEKHYHIHPLGLVMDAQVIYLVGTIEDYQDIRQFALHRFQKAICSESPAQLPEKGFSLQAYIKQGEFAFPLEECEVDEITLVLKVNAWLAAHLSERQLSENQVIESMALSNNDQPPLFKVTATVLNTAQLRWWVLGLENQIEVLAPESLRQRLGTFFQQQSMLYADSLRTL